MTKGVGTGRSRVRSPDGEGAAAPSGLSPTELRTLYELMLRSRDFDRRAVSAQRLGRIGTYPMLEGHEAVQVGSAFALEVEDWVYPNYRQHGVQIARGIPLDVILAYWRGLPASEWDVHRYRTMPIAVSVATALPHAVGHAYAARLAGRPVVTAAYLGDGATSASDFHAALNFAAVWRTPTIFICENNQYAISTPYALQTATPTIAEKAAAYGIVGVRVDGMDVLAVHAATRAALERARAGEGPTLIEALCYRFGPHATTDDDRLYRPDGEEAEWRTRDPLARFRDDLVAQGLWSDELEQRVRQDAEVCFETAMAKLESLPLPGREEIVRHAYHRLPKSLVRQLHTLQSSAAEPLTEFDGGEIATVDAERPLPAATESLTMAQAINAALHQAMERDERVVVLGQDVGRSGGVFRVTAELQQAFGPARVIDTPLNESGIVGAAVGMAIAGRRPVAEIQFDGFAYPAFDQIVGHVGRMRFRSRGRIGLPMVIRWPNGAGVRGHEMHSDSPEAYFAHAHGLTVVMPSTPRDAKGLLAAAIESEDPVLFLEPKALYRSLREAVPAGHYTTPLGAARVRRRGRDLTLVAYGGLVPKAVRAAAAAAERGIEVEVIDLRTLHPWDEQTVTTSVERTRRLLVVQESKRSLGLGAEIAAQIAETSGALLATPVRRLTATDAPWPPFALEHHALVTADQMLATVVEMVQGAPQGPRRRP